MPGKVFGNTVRDYCPVCDGKNITNVWKIPMTKIDTPLMINGAKFSRVPLLNSEIVYHFSECKDCESVFLSPYSGNYWDDRIVTHHAEKARKRSEWSSYEERIGDLQSFLSKGMDIVVDVASGGGQCLTILKERGYSISRMIGLDIMQPSVDYIKSLGFEGYRHDVCMSMSMIDDNSVDLMMFYEAFEHVRTPYLAIKNISHKMKVGGLLALTSQSIEGGLPVRPEESIYTNYSGLEKLLNNNNLEVVTKKNTSGRWRVIARKKMD